MVSASNAGSIPKGDITKEVWKRINHNLPYLLQTKGTERGLKALISCYGIPESILHVKEYGGPVEDKTGFRSFTYQKASQMAKVDSSFYPNGAYAIASLNDVNFTNTKTLQVTFLPEKGYTEPQDIIGLIKTPSPGDKNISIGISQSFSEDKLESGSFAHLVIASGSFNSNDKVSSSLGPIYNGDVWNLSVVIDSGSDGTGNKATAYATNTTKNKNTYVLSCSLDLSDNEFDIDRSTYVASDVTDSGTPINLIGPFSGSVQEYRRWSEKLTKDTIVTQSLSPFNYNGNNISSSYESLLVRLSLGSNDQDLPTTVVTDLNFAPNKDYRDLYTPTVFGANGVITPHPIEETHHLTTPDTVGKSTVSDKVRLDTGVIDDNILSPFVRSETSTYDRQPNDYSDLGVFFSPTFEVNEDIIYTLGGFRLDDYIGDPRHFASGSYPDLEEIKEVYTQKIAGRLTNIWDYLKLIQQFDHTLFKMVEQFAPAKANLKTGLVIEPHYLERPKLKGTHITTDPTYNEFDFNIDNPEPTTTGENIHYDADYDVYDVITEGSRGSVENNAIYGIRSSRFYTRIVPFAQSITTDGVVTNTDDLGGGPIPLAR